MIQAIIKHKWLTSFCIVVLSFGAFNLFLFPIFNSGDDVFLMYTLAGGYGEAPTNLLHYNHIWHPALGWIVKSLFAVLPAINWYTVFLVIIQAAGCSAMVYVLLKRSQLFIALLFYILFFFFVEVRVLLSLNFTSSAWVLASGGYALLLDAIPGRANRTNIFIACLLLLVAGLLRLHIVLLVTLLFFPCFIFFASKEYKRWGVILIGITGLVFLFNLQHQGFYKKHIPDWQQQESLRQSLFSVYNRPINTTRTDSGIFLSNTEKAFFAANFFYDSSFLSSERIEQISEALVKQRSYKANLDFEGLYWSFMEWRVYILLLGIAFFIAWRTGYLKTVFRYWAPLALFALLVYFILAIFFKMTFTIYMGFLMMLFIYSIWILPHGYKFVDTIKSIKLDLSLLLLLAPFIWICIRIAKTDNQNREKHLRFTCAVEELARNPDKLFIATDDALPLGFFHIWSLPARNKMTNLIYKDRMLTHTYDSTLLRFGITDIMHSIYENPKVFLTGKEFPELKDYYKRMRQYSIEISSEFKEFSCLEVRKILQLISLNL